MEEKELELFKRAWLFLSRETAARWGLQLRDAVIREAPGGERPTEKDEAVHSQRT